MQNRDYLIMGIITLIFAILVFYRIGSFSAPENAYTATEENCDIVLDFGGNTHISHLYIFLGPPDNRPFTISAFNIENDMWDLLNGNINAGEVFTWNRIDISYYLRYLGLVAMGNETVVKELAVFNAEGVMITPRNADDYPGLFDEQETFSPTFSPTYFGGMMFDEIYHGRTAYEFIHGLPAYETTHPPLGKALIAGGIRLFGMNPFGWRFIPALFGILLLPLTYAFGKTLFHDTFAAAAVTVLLAADNMHFALSRIATVDIIAAFFIMLMYYLMLRFVKADRQGGTVLIRFNLPGKKTLNLPVTRSFIPLGLCGIAMGLAIATKWTGVYAGAGLALLFLWYLLNHYPVKLRRLLLFCVVFFGIIPFFIYVFSYRPFVTDPPAQSLIQAAFDNSAHMFSYHADLDAPHYYGTYYYDWPTLRMPLLYATDPVGDLMSSVNCMGNPAIWWLGIPCIFFCVYRFLVKKDLRAGFLVLAYLAQYLPWFFITRITFIYHYFPAALFMILMMGYTLYLLSRYRTGRQIVYVFLVLAVIVFFIFYPVTSGIPGDRDYQFSLRWLEDWILVL